MSQYAVPDSYYARYPARKQSVVSAEAQALLQEASLRVDMNLATSFTVPFSSNNLTATWLSILLAEYILRSRMEDPKKMQGLAAELTEVFCAILAVQRPMLDSSGGQIWANVTQQVGAAGHVTAVDGGFLPVFTMDKPEYQIVDGDRLTDERGRRDIPATDPSKFPWTGDEV